MPPTPTATLELRNGARQIVFTRSLPTPVERVWAALTEPDEMCQWIGTWTGDPASGRVDFRMTAEGEDVPTEPHDILTCEPPHHLVVRPAAGDAKKADRWRLTFELTTSGEQTVLTMAQPVADAEAAEQTGPGWEYYLDRLTAVLTGAEVDAVEWDAYYPTMVEHFRGLVR